MMFIWVLLCHWFGCAYYGIGYYQKGEPNIATGGPWIEEYIPFADTKTKYTSSIYWAVVTMLTVGYGDISAYTNVEKCWTIFNIIMGSLIYATIFGSVSLLIQTAEAPAS